MSSFRTQSEAIGSALVLIERLPAHTVWALTVTNDDDGTSPSVLNVFAEYTAWPSLMTSLRLGRPVDTDRKFWSFRQGTLLVSFIEPEDNNG